MSTPAASGTTRATGERRVAKLFGLQGETWMRHANPLSVWTRFAVLPLLAASIWSRDWIGWWSLVPLVLSLVFMVVNPLLFPKPRSTRNWTKRVLAQTAKAWYIDRMVLLFEDMKARRPQYAAWDYGPETGPARRPTPERP
jgi:Family of unknown function (DUF6653)